METEVGRILVRILGDAAGYLKALGTASTATQAFSQTVSGLLGALGGASIMAAGQMEQLEISFRVLTGSAALAKKTIDDLVAFAVATPFEVPQIVQAAKQMIAFGTHAMDIVPVMRMLGDVSASLGTPLGDLVYLFGTLRAQGRAYMLDINQFAMRGIPIWEELAKVLGVTKAEVRALVTDGKVGFEQVEAAFKGMTAEGGKFHGMMAEQAKSLFGMWSNLKDSFGVFLRALGKLITDVFNLKGIIGGLTSFVGVLAKAMGDVTAWFQNLNPVIQDIIRGFVTLIPLFLGLQAILAVVTALGGLFVARVVALVAGLARFGVWLAASPFTPWIIAFTAILTLISGIIDGIKRIETEGAAGVVRGVGGAAWSLVDIGGGAAGSGLVERAVRESGAITPAPVTRPEPTLEERLDTRTSDMISRVGDIRGPRARKDFLSAEIAELRRMEAVTAPGRAALEAALRSPVDSPYRRSLERLTTELEKTSATFRDAEHKAKSFVETLASETATMGMSKHEAERYRLALSGVSGETLRLVDAAIKMNEIAATQKKLADDTKDFTNRLREQSSTLGMTTLAAERYRLAARGASEVTLSWADSMIATIEAFERHERLVERGKALTERFATPQERLARTQVELNELYRAGAITMEIYSRALADVARETRNLHNESRNSLLYNSQEARDFLEGYRNMLRQRPLMTPTGGMAGPSLGTMGTVGASALMAGGASVSTAEARLTEIRDLMRRLVSGGGVAIVPAALR